MPLLNVTYLQVKASHLLFSTEMEKWKSPNYDFLIFLFSVIFKAHLTPQGWLLRDLFGIVPAWKGVPLLAVDTKMLPALLPREFPAGASMFCMARLSQILLKSKGNEG